MKAIKMLVFILILACIYACGSKPYPHSMQIADSLVASNPDSATVLLEQLEEKIASEPESTQMYYRLLSIKAKDKAYVTHTSDSLIKTVVKYYEKEEDKKRLPEAYYYAGRVHRDLGDTPQALDYFLKAIGTSKESANHRLISMIYNQMGMIYLYQGSYEKALDGFKKAYYQTTLCKDSILIVYNLRDIGRAFTGLNIKDSTLSYFKKAEKAAIEIKNSHLISIINQEIAGIYTQLGDYKNAHIAIQSSLHDYIKDNAPYYATLANLYSAEGKNDSAQYYYTKLLSIGNHYHKQGGYEGLYRIARSQGKLLDAFSYMDKYLIYTDSIRKSTDAEATQKINALFNYQLREKENTALKVIAQNQKKWIWTLSVSTTIALIIILASSIIYIQYKKQRKIQIERQQEKLKEIANEQYRNSQKFISENEKHIEELKERLQSVENQKDALKRSLQETEKELLELTNKQIEAKLKVQKLSETAFKNSQIYKDFYHVAGMPNSENISQKEKLTSNDWKALFVAVNQTYSNFSVRLQDFYPNISEHELRICILLKIGIPPMGIAKLTAHSKQAITSSRKKLYIKTHNQDGTSDLWDKFISNF